MFSSSVSATQEKILFVIPFGKSSSVTFNGPLGIYKVIINGKLIIDNAISKVIINEKLIKSSDYQSIKIRQFRIRDKFGRGIMYRLTLSKPGLPTMEQHFYTYTGKDYYLSEVVMNGTNVSSNRMTPLFSDKVSLNAPGDNRILFVPFDNDTFIRYDAKSTVRDIRNSSSEVTAFYDNTSRKGLVVGSVEHMTWKTGIESEGKGDKLSVLDVFGGYAEKDVTRDQIAHGDVTGSTIKSPKIFVGYFSDWRTGLENYGKANRLAEPPFVFNWTKPVPFGWNSWGVIQEKLSYEKAINVVDYFAAQLPEFRNGETAYIDLDSFWDNFTGGMRGDYSKLKAFADYCKQKGLQPGVYWAPFTDWGFKSKNDREAEGSSYKFSEMWTKVNDGYHDFDGARALDPTHPGTLRRIDYIIDKLNACGFKMIKIDFLGHAAAESTSFYDKSVTTGMQAYRVGMEYLVKRLDGNMLIYAAISPSLATGRYAHTRRIACDAWKTIKDTEYTVNSVNYGWWQTYVYNFIDADHVVFGTEGRSANKARLASALITGTLITGDDFSKPGVWDEQAKTLLANKELLDVARTGLAFKPLNGNTGTSANPVFVRQDKGYLYIALFNYGKDRRTFDIPLADLGLMNLVYQSTDLFTAARVELNKKLLFSLEPSDAAILKIKLQQ
ncbi:MAG: alpha-galactosidase [Bacteroidota bacterium]